MFCVVCIYHCHRIPFHSMFFQEADAMHHFFPRWFSGRCLSVMIMIFLWTIDGDTYQKMVLSEKLTPFIGKECTIGLDDVIDLLAVGVLLLQFQRLLVEVDGAHQRFSSMPGEEYLVHGLCFDVFLGKLLQHLVGHEMPLRCVVEVVFLQIITVFAI